MTAVAAADLDAAQTLSVKRTDSTGVLASWNGALGPKSGTSGASKRHK